MKLKKLIQTLTTERAMSLAQQIAIEFSIDWKNETQYVFRAIVNDPERAPGNIGTDKDNEFSVIKKWLSKYKNGFDGRASNRISNPPGTIADPIIEQIIGSRLTHLSISDLNRITYAHRLSMSAENILGLILEEYLSDNLNPHGWHCAWGETVKSVDFVHKDGRLLQIKNRSNSENSSSSAVRIGTKIEKWYRIKAGKIEYMWDSLNDICKTTHLSEESFALFVKKLLSSNPHCLAVEQDNPWS